LLFAKAQPLDEVHGRVHGEPIRLAIEKLLSVVTGLKISREEVSRHTTRRQQASIVRRQN